MGRLACIVQSDNMLKLRHSDSRMGDRDWVATSIDRAPDFELSEWRGELHLSDPNGLILNASFGLRTKTIAPNSITSPTNDVRMPDG